MAAALPQSSQHDPTPLAVVRFMRRLSQRELAVRSGVSERTIVYLEQRHHEPTRSTAAALCRALRVDNPDLVFPPTGGEDA